MESLQHYPEVVLISSSLSTSRSAFIQSKRAQRLLDIKGYYYILIDTNTDVSESTGRDDKALLQQWKDSGVLKFQLNEHQEQTTDVLVPQILIDGVQVGDQMDLQDLEEDDDLDEILLGNTCPACLAHRGGTAVTACPECGKEFHRLVEMDAIAEGRVQMWAQKHIQHMGHDGAAEGAADEEYGAEGDVYPDGAEGYAEGYAEGEGHADGQYAGEEVQ
eukprot:GDKI01022764.1.p2 GENE.GDKI01022764.1~~GDKI01022764.1.p2  ORF type:complete len:218 (-),score=58.26 GDKI01022764.1:156-809(-)